MCYYGYWVTWECVLLWLLGDMGMCYYGYWVTGKYVLLWLLGDMGICVTMVTW